MRASQDRSPVKNAPSLRSTIAALRRYYGPPPQPVSRDPFRLIVWEQVAYLVPDAQRRKAYDTLRREVGLSPAELLETPPATLGRITRIGGAIAAPLRAERLHQSAELVLRLYDGELRRVLELPGPKARTALARFPMIGEPAADKILLFTRTARLLALDSNALRVLARLGFIIERRDYRSTYREAQTVLAPALPKSYESLIVASQLLRIHGQELCRTSAPRCLRCPLARRCPSAALGVNAAR
jgi:endonuclease III